MQLSYGYRKEIVVIHGESTDPIHVLSGGPQRSVLEPPLY